MRVCTVSIAHSANPPPPLGSAGSSGLATTCLAFVTAIRVNRRISDVTPINLFAFYRDNEVVAAASSETAEPIVTIAGPVKDAAGAHHVACRSSVTPYEFGELLADQVGVTRDRLFEGSTADMERDATRSSHSCLAVTNVEEVLDRS